MLVRQAVGRSKAGSDARAMRLCFQHSCGVPAGHPSLGSRSPEQSMRWWCCSRGHVRLFCDRPHSTVTVSRQGPLSVRFPRQEYWAWLPFPSPRRSSQAKGQTCVSWLLLGQVFNLVLKDWDPRFFHPSLLSLTVLFFLFFCLFIYFVNVFLIGG